MYTIISARGATIWGPSSWRGDPIYVVSLRKHLVEGFDLDLDLPGVSRGMSALVGGFDVDLESALVGGFDGMSALVGGFDLDVGRMRLRSPWRLSALFDASEISSGWLAALWRNIGLGREEGRRLHTRGEGRRRGETQGGYSASPSLKIHTLYLQKAGACILDFLVGASSSPSVAKVSWR